MTVYQVTPVSNKQAGEWTSQAIQVTGDEGTKATLYLISGQSQKLEDEPPSTEMFWVIEKSDDGQSGWTAQVSATVTGNDGTPWYKPPNLSTNIDGLIGKYVRTRTTTNAAFRFGIDAEII